MQIQKHLRHSSYILWYTEQHNWSRINTLSFYLCHTSNIGSSHLMQDYKCMSIDYTTVLSANKDKVRRRGLSAMRDICHGVNQEVILIDIGYQESSWVEIAVGSERLLLPPSEQFFSYIMENKFILFDEILMMQCFVLDHHVLTCIFTQCISSLTQQTS